MSFPELDPLDRRLNAWRADLADARLQGKVEAEQFVEGSPLQVCVAFTDLRSKPDRSAGIDGRGNAVGRPRQVSRAGDGRESVGRVRALRDAV